MPIDKDLNAAYVALYDDRRPLKALQKYDAILKEHSDSLTAMVYKAASLEKLYYGYSDWHNEQTLENAKALLSKALSVAEARGDRSKIGFVYFRHFIHYYNDKQYEAANANMVKCKEYGFMYDTLPMWENQLESKLKKQLKKKAKSTPNIPGDSATQVVSGTHDLKRTAQEKVAADSIKEQFEDTKPKESTKSEEITQRFRTDWYQTSKTLVLSLFTNHLPESKDDVTAEVSHKNKKSLEVSYKIRGSSSEFQYSVVLSHEVDPEGIDVRVFTKKTEITLKKIENIQWKTLESQESRNLEADLFHSSNLGEKLDKNSLNYPSSSTKNIDWSKIELDQDEDDEKSASADAFFQKIYANADPDTQRAMMKSFVESNGTALNTNWDDVSKKPVEPSPPEGMDLKKW